MKSLVADSAHTEILKMIEIIFYEPYICKWRLTCSLGLHCKPYMDVINNNEDVAAVNKTIRLFIMPSHEITIGLFTVLHSS